ncbi:MAG: aromatic aminobenezylarsenical efflux permease ArsG family transporter [Porphyromonadaceae bacterium]|nr:aromatic aminobenezylarsenical efflux permease ArsG family transporter [Porphyromonadaceae bacterium]
MNFLQSLSEGSGWPLFTAFLLGLMTALSPCPLATNITATAYLGKDIGIKKRVLFNGIFYTLGRMFTYTALGALFFFGASQLKIAVLLQSFGGVWLGIALLLIGFFMLDIIPLNLPGAGKLTEKLSNKEGKKTYWDAFLLGLLFALAFCPYSAMLYFGGLIPMTIASPSGLLLPPTFAIATGLPVIIIAWIIAYSVSNIGKFYNSLNSFQKWFKRIVAALFIIVGVYYIIISV